MASNTPEASQKRQGKQRATSTRQQDGSAPKPRRKPRDRSHPQNHAALVAEDATPPSTPPKPTKPHPTSATIANGQNLTTQNKSRKKSPTPLNEVHPPPPPMAATTPAKPLQIYAGPTFHASPAASSLPIPKMFSKSMPQINDPEASLHDMMHGDISEGSSEPEGSPTLWGMPRAGGEAVQESPLDIFFKRDREEKARLQVHSSQNSLVTPPNTRRAQSSSPGPGSSSSKLRPPEGSVFPFDLEGRQSTQAPPSRLEDSPSIEPMHPNARSAEARAKTEALKNLLRFQTPGPRSVSESNSLSGSRSSSRPPTAPPSFERSASDQALTAGGFPKHVASSINGPPRYNTRHASQLRQQLDQVAQEHFASNPSPPRARPSQDSHHYPSTSNPPVPTPSSPYRASPGPMMGPQGARNPVRGNHPMPSSQGGEPNTAAMEEQLRRILKLDSIPSAGVQS